MTKKNIFLKFFLLALIVTGVGAEGQKAEATTKSVSANVNGMPALSLNPPYDSIDPGTYANLSYKARLINADTRATINEDSIVPVGTRLEIVRSNSTLSSDIVWGGTGRSVFGGSIINHGSLYGYWVNSAADTTTACLARDLFSSETFGFGGGATWGSSQPGSFVAGVATRNVYVKFNVNPPAITRHVAVTGPVSCNSSVCTVTGSGSISIGVRFESTFGRFYHGNDINNTSCDTNSSPLNNGASAYNATIPAATITFNLTGAAAPINNASCEALQTNPTTVTAGATFGAGARIRNTGNTTWTAASGYQLASVNPTWNTRWVSPTFGSVGNQVVLPNQEAWFLRVFTAPTTAGNYSFDWQMFVSYFPFGDICRLDVNVVGGASCTQQPLNSTYHTGDNVGLSVDTASTHNLDNTGIMCEYFCNTGFEYSGGSCVPVAPPPNVVLTASPATIEAGNSSTLTWSVGGQVTACEASLGWSGVKSTAGDSEDVSPLTTTNYRLSCVGPGGTTAKTATVNVTSSPVVGSCSALPGTNASFHPGDNSVSVNTTSLHSDTNTNAQCEFFCSPPSSWNSSTCVAPAPTPVPTDLTISVGGQSIIRSGGKVNVTWTAKSEDPLLNCVVTGGGISDNFKPSDAWPAVYTKSSQTTTLANATTFSLKCSDGTRNFEAFDRVEVIPSFQEI